jgi:hypothetical protein
MAHIREKLAFGAACVFKENQSAPQGFIEPDNQNDKHGQYHRYNKNHPDGQQRDDAHGGVSVLHRNNRP